MRNNLVLLLFGLVFFSGSVIAQKVTTVKGTIGKEKEEDMFVVCVFGTAACMPLGTDKDLKTSLNGKILNITELPVGVYIEAEIEETKDGGNRVKSIHPDINKTVICFTEMNGEDQIKLNKLLDNTKGINKHKFYDSSLQVYIEYDHEQLNYQQLEKAIVEAGLKVE